MSSSANILAIADRKIPFTWENSRGSDGFVSRPSSIVTRSVSGLSRLSSMHFLV